jgi:hypothetical protein
MLNTTSLVRFYGTRRLRKLVTKDVADIQQRQLLGLVARASRTAFGRDHDFKSIRSVTEFQAKVPLRRYEEFQERYWGPAFPDLKGVTWSTRVPISRSPRARRPAARNTSPAPMR